MIPSLKPADSKKFEKAIAPNRYDIKEKSTKATTIVVRAPANDRNRVRTALEKKLKSVGLKSIHKTGGGSIGTTEILFDYHTIRVTYKPISGGMSETTLNSTITELAPAIAFMSGKKKFRTVEEFHSFLVNSRNTSVYLNDSDAKAGANFIESMPTSTKFKEKMENAMAILDFLNKKNSESPIKQVYWGYRAKPKGIPPTHKGDIFLQFGANKFLGVSLKAGGENTAEPQLNTYVNKFFDDFGREKQKQKLIKDVYNNIHAKLGLPDNWQDRSERSNSIKTIMAYKKKYPKKYEDMYDDMLGIVRDSIIANVNSNMRDTIAYIEKQILKKDNEVPLLVVKAFGRSYKYVTDEDALGSFLSEVTQIKAYPSSSSKQNWYIDLIASKKKKLTMNMTVRSNKTEPDNKVAQGYNLAIKFNGIAKS